MINFFKYKKKYGSKIIMEVPKLELDSGIYWLKGGNGSGKTTLISSIAGIIPFDGEIKVNGISIKRESILYRRVVNHAIADPIFPGFLSGTELISFYQKTKNADVVKVKLLIDAMNIGNYTNSDIRTYSSGMVKKLSLVLAFIGNPILILLDEPLITLDQQSMLNLQQLLVEEYRAGVSFIIASHQELQCESKELMVKNGLLKGI